MSAVTILGFDFGHRYIGVAVGQTVTRTATALTSVRVTARSPAWDRIGHLIDEWQPGALVVGLPINMDGTEQALTRDAQRFANRLRARFRLPVHGADERLSTREARARLAADNRRGDDDHALAAQVILETWFTTPASAGGPPAGNVPDGDGP